MGGHIENLFAAINSKQLLILGFEIFYHKDLLVHTKELFILIDKDKLFYNNVFEKITDYNILVLKNTEDEVDEIITNLRLNIINKEIFISCYMCLKSFEKYKDLTHLLLYTNTTEDAELSKKYINGVYHPFYFFIMHITLFFFFLSLFFPFS